MTTTIIICITLIVIVAIICYTSYKLSKSDRVNNKVDDICNDVSWIKTDIKALNLIYDDILAQLKQIKQKLDTTEK